MRPEVLRARNICKSVAGVPVLEGVNFNIFPGEMVAVIGLQYSGKSVLSRILSGMDRPDSGTLLVDDEPAHFSGIAEAQKAGVFSVSKELQLISSMSIAENFFVVNGNNASKGVFSERKNVKKAKIVLQGFDVDLDPSAKVREFSSTEQRMIEMIKIVLQRPKIIIIDSGGNFEIRDAQAFRGLFRKILDMGIAIMTIGNKLDDVIYVCDRVYPLKDGVFGRCIDKSEYSHEKLFRALTGQELPTSWNMQGESAQGQNVAEELMRAENLSVGGGPMNFSVRRGEITALVINDSAAARRTAYALFGEERVEGGWIIVGGRPALMKSAADAIKLGIVMVPGDVRREGVFDSLSISENISLLALAREHRNVGIPPKRMAGFMAKSIGEHYGIEYKNGNMPLWRAEMPIAQRQKIAIARWGPMKQKVYIFLNPFANVDENTSDELAKIFRELADSGAGVLIISSGVYKLKQLCDDYVFPE